MMESRQAEKADSSINSQKRDVCEACGDGLDTKRRTVSRSYSITTLEALCRIDLLDSEKNPFANAFARARARMPPTQDPSVSKPFGEANEKSGAEDVVEEIITCSICHREWKQMSYRRTKQTRVASLLQAWRRRRERYSDAGPKKGDLFCLPCMLCASVTIHTNLSRNPTHYHDLLSILSSPPVVQDMWCSEFTRTKDSRAEMKDSSSVPASVGAAPCSPGRQKCSPDVARESEPVPLMLVRRIFSETNLEYKR